VGRKNLGGFGTPGYGPGQSRDREAPDTLSASALFALVRPFACRGRLRNLLADCCTPGQTWGNRNRQS